jgi:hypothetical protein
VCFIRRGPRCADDALSLVADVAEATAVWPSVEGKTLRRLPHHIHPRQRAMRLAAAAKPTSAP